MGGQPAALYPNKVIQDIPVFRDIKSFELTEKLCSNLSDDTDIYRNYKVENIIFDNSHFIINDDLISKTILITTGNGAFKPKAFPLAVPDNIESKISYFVKNPQDYQDKQVAVLGGGDSALDWALELSQYAKVSLIHRRNQFRGLESNVEKVKKNPKVSVLTPYLPADLTENSGRCELSLKKVGTDETNSFIFDNLIVAYGFRANNRFIKKWGIELENDLIKVDRKMETSVKGIFAAGDSVGYEGRVPIIGIGFGEAQIAITSIMQTIFPDKQLTIHSTSI
ncbi:thioredoxin reductase [Lactobacillus jensenii DSM 20557]|nr:pyridine nucleotide-disulfide oxidoreductase [Lactobacillus jensenii 269-3]EEX27416.1 pyridine nucleotide-disulfide oxidoreductase [Lactobacillus jensenii SJ-7A-US]KRM49367.1 thioredoxin reductase [Lactobacillus jensenii DSM 20557]